MSLLGEKILLFMTKNYRSEWDHGDPNIKAEEGTEEHETEYAFYQLKFKTKYGIEVDVYGKSILEIGCGHGGISVYAAMNGAKEVVGTDLSDVALKTADKFKSIVEKDLGHPLPLRFEYMSAEKLDFSSGTLDLVIADNVLEHVEDLEEVLNECNRALKTGGRIVVPNFPSILSKFGPHVKYGIKIPWVHVFFSEKTIVRVMHELAKTDPVMHIFYPGLKQDAKTFKEARAYKDLNYITNRKFLNAVGKTGFNIEKFYVKRPLAGMILFKLLPFMKHTRLSDIASYGTSAILVKS